MSAQAPDFDSRDFRSALGRFATGVTIVTATHPQEGHPIGLTVSSFNSVSLNPPLILWSLIKSSSNREAFEQIQRYNIHILNAEQLALARQFSTGSPQDRFHDVLWTPGTTSEQVPKLDDRYCSAWFECYNRNHYHEGDHMILIGEVERCHHIDSLPLVYHAGSFDLTPTLTETQ